MTPQLQVDQPNFCLPFRNLEDREARLQVEARRTGSAGIHDQAAICLHDQGRVRVAVHDDVGRITSEQLLGPGDAELVSMADVDAETVDGHVDRRAQAGVARCVGVSVNSMHRRDDGEFVEDLVAADVARVEDQLNPLERFVDFRPYKPVRVGNQAKPSDGGGRMAEVGQLLRPDYA